MTGGNKAAISRPTQGGFTLTELLVTVALVAILGALSASAISDNRKKTSLHKLRSDVRVINAAAMNYEVFAGSLASATTASDVLAKLRSRADALSAEQTAGLTGSFIDRRIRAEMQSGLEASQPQPRAIWNASKRQFEIAFDGIAGVKRFVLDEAYAAQPIDEESRTPTMKLATRGNWIWDYHDAGAPAGPSLPSVPLTTPGPSSPPIIPGPPGGSPSVLQPPHFSIASGTRPITAYNLPLEFTNPNPNGVSRIVYSLNNGAWIPYAGAPVVIPPATNVRAFAETMDADWLNSPSAENHYQADPVQLTTPLISATSSKFDHGQHRTVRIVLQNFNDPEVSTLSYSIGGIGWQNYDGPFLLDVADHPGGAGIRAVAVPTADYYTQSMEATHDIAPAEPLRLAPPVIHLTPDPGDTGFVALTFDNPNPAGSSEIDFLVLPVPSSLGCDLLQGRVAPEGLLTYAAAFPIDALDFSEHYSVVAYSRSTGPSYIDSVFTVKYGEQFTSGLRGGHFDVDTSSTIAPVGDGSTDGHVHAYDNKFDTTIIDFFNLLDSKLHNITEDIADPGTRFKLIVVNANLTPDAMISLNHDPSGASIAGTTYDNTSIDALPVYSLGGVDGTVKLEKLALHFDAGAITNAGLIPTNTGDVRKNVPGKNGEWRNGAFTIQAVRVNDDGTPAFDTDPSLSAGTHGPATNGLLWESTVFWHWDGKSYHDPQNPYIPRDVTTVRDNLEDGDEEPICDL